MSRAFVVAASAGVLSLAGCGGHDRGRAPQVGDPHAAVLRAGDMPRGYREGDDTSCGLSTTEGADPQLDRLLADERPEPCVVELNRVWPSAAGPRVVTSAAYVFRDTSGAERGFDARTSLLRYVAAVTARTERKVDLGDEARLVRGGGLNAPAAAVVWRSDNAVAVLAVEPSDARAALRLARRQQERIAGIAPPPRQVDTVALALDDPSLKFPVYWLGRSFDPAGRLPALELEEASVLSTGPGSAVKLDYGMRGGSAVGVTLDLWRPPAWRAFRRTLLGRLVWDSRCARKTTVRLQAGRAEIFEGYGTPRPLRPPCPARPHDRVIAHVYLPQVVVTVDMPYCYVCAAARGVPNPYETAGGMTAIARGLRLRSR